MKEIQLVETAEVINKEIMNKKEKVHNNEWIFKIYVIIFINTDNE